MTRLIVGRDGGLYLWEAKSGEPVQTFVVHNHFKGHMINALSYIQEKNYLLSGSTKRLYLTDMKTAKDVHESFATMVVVVSWLD